jgi:rubrerythrin
MTMSDSAVLALEQALKFESDGREFYLLAAEEANNSLVKAIFTALAEEELSHVARVRAIYEELKNNSGWPDEITMVAAQTGVVDVFEREAARLPLPADISVRGALKKALDLEKEAMEFYSLRLLKASCKAETAFYKRLVAEETFHLETLKKALGES